MGARYTRAFCGLITSFFVHSSLLTPRLSSPMSDLTPFDYILPPELIAQQPLLRRADARLMVVDRQTGTIDHRHVRDLPEILRSGDSLVTNNTRVVPARVVGIRTATGGQWEGLFLSVDERGNWRMLCKTRGKLRPPETVTLLDRQQNQDIQLWLIEREDSGMWLAHPANDESAYQILDRVGRVPLPPYIRAGEMSESDTINYQTVFAKHRGAVAAPTAGLHFTSELLNKLQAAGVTEHEVTLHVGLDTFRPIAVENLDEHKMHSEWGEITHEIANAINERRAAGGRIIAVGTTSVRVLESAAIANEPLPNPDRLRAWSGNTTLFIRPPYQFKAVDALMTNFHLPRTTLLILVSTFAGTELIQRAYEAAIQERYRFYSYGDAMLIV